MERLKYLIEMLFNIRDIAPIRQILLFRKRITAKTSHEKWIFVRDFVTIFYRLTFCPITDPNFKVYWYTWICAIAFIVSDVLAAYMLFVNRDNLFRHALNLFSLGVSGVVSVRGQMFPRSPNKISISSCFFQAPIHFARIVTRSRYEYQNLIHFGVNYIYSRVRPNAEERILNARAAQLMRNVFLLSAILVTGFLLYLALPAFQLLFTGERITSLPYLLPFTELNTNRGYYINIVNQIWIAHFICISNVGNDCTFAMILNSLWAATDLIKYSLAELSEALEADGFQFEHQSRLRNIFVQIQDLNRLIIRWKALFYTKFLVAPICVAISLPVALISIMVVSVTVEHIEIGGGNKIIFFLFQTNRLPAYGYVIFGYGQLLLLCHMGNQVLLIVSVIQIGHFPLMLAPIFQRESLATSMYEIPWYLLPAKQQKEIIHVLRGIQNGCKLSIGPFAELNFETASNVCFYFVRKSNEITDIFSFADNKDNLFVLDDVTENHQKLNN